MTHAKPTSSESQAVWNLDELWARVDNDQELLRDLLHIFREDFPRTMASLRGAIAAADLNSTASLGHTLRGMLANLAAARAASAASEVERSAKAADTVALRAALDHLEQESGSLLPQIETYLSEVLA